MESNRLILKIPSARLRAEVFINKKFVAYSIINGIQIETDITDAVVFGAKNKIVIRITNPGGRRDSTDYHSIKWGNTGQEFFTNYCFGGLDAGIFIDVKNMISISDFFIFSSPKIKKYKLNIALENRFDYSKKIIIEYKLLDKQNGDIIIGGSFNKQLQNVYDTISLCLPNDSILKRTEFNPNQYSCIVEILNPVTKKIYDTKMMDLSFRLFEVNGTDSNTFFTLNNERISLNSPVFPVFINKNGFYPTEELIEDMLLKAKEQGIRCLKLENLAGIEEVLEVLDTMGLYCCLMPAGGQFATGEFSENESGQRPKYFNEEEAEPQSFSEKYMEAKILAMVKQNRCYQSLLMYSIQSEIGDSIINPRIFNLIRKIHKLDPGRMVIFHSDSNAVNKVWMRPFDDSVYIASGLIF
jgi:hypothetical protein